MKTGGTHAEGASWRLYPRLLLRRAGFGVELLTDLADGAVAGAAADYRLRADEFEARRGLSLAALRAEVDSAAGSGDRELLRLLSRARGRIGRRRPLDGPLAGCGPAALGYTGAWRAREAAWSTLAGALAAERDGRTAKVRRVLDDERLLDAVLQLAPSFAAEVDRFAAAPPRAGGPTAKDRAFLRRVYLYCQRLGAKNETTSFFGPLVHGEVTAAPEGDAGNGAAGVVTGPETSSGTVETEAFLAFWAVCELAAVLARDPRVARRLPVSWIAACRHDGDSLTLPDGRRVRLTGEQRRVVDLVDGERSVLALARGAGLGTDEVTEVVERLQRAGALRHRPEPPSTAPRPLDWLTARADRYAADTPWPGALRGLAHRAALYAQAEGPVKRRAALEAVESAFSELTGGEARRAGGRMYADRMVVSLDAKGDQGPVRVGAGTAARWERELTPVLDVAARYGELLQSACAELCADLLREAGVGRMPYDELIRRSAAAVAEGRLDGYTARADAFAAEVARVVTDAVRTDGGGPPAAVLTAEELAPLAPARDRARFVSPDLMLEAAGPGGEPEGLVLGELHPYVFAWGSQGLFDHDPEGTRAAFGDRLAPWGGAARLATVIRRRRHKGLVGEWFPGRFVEITAVATDDRSRAVPVTALSVELDGARARLMGPDGELVLYAGEDDHVHLRAFAAPTAVLPPVVVDGMMPRWGVGALIAQRARWWITPADLGPGAGKPSADEVFRAVQGLRVALGLPRYVFAHISGEPKPVGVDLDAPLAVETLAALATASGTERIALTEMRPAPDRLWLRRQGRAVTSEFRLALHREPG
ncbi:lantibiotic dehydratase [Streptomyces uncialis]|uniref:lantibiotic dehydratase n=1 Tax=Streptomyces uncialis TaxID=1048205 RepID=UPI0022555ADE|nr:lantibiotic dehydratase [Streptomyces uncialis]MCX4662781.1 lantibiotic dehydratase [Streptomyces uncialis]